MNSVRELNGIHIHDDKVTVNLAKDKDQDFLANISAESCSEDECCLNNNNNNKENGHKKKDHHHHHQKKNDLQLNQFFNQPNQLSQLIRSQEKFMNSLKRSNSAASTSSKKEEFGQLKRNNSVGRNNLIKSNVQQQQDGNQTIDLTVDETAKKQQGRKRSKFRYFIQQVNPNLKSFTPKETKPNNNNNSSNGNVKKKQRIEKPKNSNSVITKKFKKQFNTNQFDPPNMKLNNNQHTSRDQQMNRNQLNNYNQHTSRDQQMNRNQLNKQTNQSNPFSSNLFTKNEFYNPFTFTNNKEKEELPSGSSFVIDKSPILISPFNFTKPNTTNEFKFSNLRSNETLNSNPINLINNNIKSPLVSPFDLKSIDSDDLKSIDSTKNWPPFSSLSSKPRSRNKDEIDIDEQIKDLDKSIEIITLE